MVLCSIIIIIIIIIINEQGTYVYLGFISSQIKELSPFDFLYHIARRIARSPVGVVNRIEYFLALQEGR